MKKLLFLLFIIFALAISLTGCFFSPEDVVFEDAQFIYDGSIKEIVSPTEIPERFTLEYEANTATDAGKYICKVYVYNTRSGELECEKSAILEILPAEYDMSSVVFDSVAIDYDGKAHVLEIHSPLPDSVSVSYTENTFTDAGIYEVTASFSGDVKNYKPIDSMSATITIKPVVAPVKITPTSDMLTTSSTPKFTTDIAGAVIFREGQTLVPGTNTYYCDFIPQSPNYTKNENIAVTLTVKASVKYYNGDTLIKTEYVDYGRSIAGVTVNQFEKNDTLYTFSHWENSSGEKISGQDRIKDDTTLHAVFAEEKKLFLTLDYGSGKTEKFGFYQSKLPYALPTLNAGFDGWHESIYYTSNTHSSVTDASLKGKTLYALYIPQIKLSNGEYSKKPSYETVKITLTESDVYAGTLIAVNGDLSSKVKKSSLDKISAVTDSVISDSKLLLHEKAIEALDALGKEYTKKNPKKSLTVSNAFSDAKPDLEGGYSVILDTTDTKAFLSENAADYGFVLRYPDTKQGYTGVTATDGLYRYVGVPHSIFMTRYDLTLEEYLRYVKQYTDTHLYFVIGDTEYEIFYAASVGSETSINIPKNAEYTVSGNNSDGFVITVKREYKRTLNYSVCIDAGHGGHDPGAPGGESIINLAVSKLLAAECERQGFSVIMTRDDDYYLTLNERCVVANNAKADIFVSIHCNSAESKSASGTEVFYYYGEKSISLANKVYEKMVTMVPLKKRGVAKKDLHVIRYTNMPAILCELAFLSNTSDYALLHSEQTQALWAEAICRGICEYFGVEYLE